MGERWFDLPDASCATASGTIPEAAGRAERTRARLLETAALRFAEQGYHRTTLRDVLADTGVTKGALYFHFGSKIELARAVCGEASRSWDAVLAVIAARDLDPLQELLVQSDVTMVRFTQDLALRAALRVAGEAEELDGMLARWRASWEDRTTALLERAHDKGLLLSWTRPASLGRQVVALMLGHQTFTVYLPLPVDDPWLRMNESWDGVLAAVAARDWLADWRASGWHERSRPVW